MVAITYETKTFEEAVTLTGFGKFNLFILLATGGSLMCVIIETMSAMFITPAAQCDLNLTLGEKGLLYSISFFGVVSSSHLWGYLADTKGRKNVIIFSLVSSAIISIIGSFVSIVWLFILLRFLNGFLIGGSSAIIYAFVGEFHDNRYRPKVVSWIATFVAFGNIFLPSMAWLILSLDWSLEIPYLEILHRPWRLLIVVYALPSLISVILVSFLPESPKYLMSRGKNEDALKILRKMYSVNSGKSTKEFPVDAIFWQNQNPIDRKEGDGMLKSMWKQTVPIFERKYILKTCMVCYLHFSIFLTSSSVIMWYPEILNSMSKLLEKSVADNEVTMCKAIVNFSVVESANNLSSTECQDSINNEVFPISIYVGLSYSVCYIAIGSFINMAGPRRLLVGFIVVATFAGLCAQLLNSYTYIQISIGIFLMVATGVGIVNAIVVDLYPTEIRGMALAVSLMFGRFGAMAGSNIAGPIFFNFCDYLFYVIAALHIVAIIIITLLPSHKSSGVSTTKELSNVE